MPSTHVPAARTDWRGTSRRLLGATTMIGALSLTAACGGSSVDGASGAGQSGGSSAGSGEGGVQVQGVGTVVADPAVAAKLPEAVKAKGLTVATNAPYAPFIDFAKEGVTDEFKGLEYDLLQAAGGKLGVPVRFVQQPFDGLVPGLQAGKYDAIVGGITDNKERQATATFVDMSASGTGILVKKGGPAVTTLQDLCGQQVAVQKAAKQLALLKAFSAESCGGKAIRTTEYPQNTDAVQALLAGKASAVAATKVNLAETAKQVGERVELVDDPAAPNGYQASPNGVGVLKDDEELAGALQAAVQSLIDDGTYGKILAGYGQQGLAVKTATLNAAVD